MQKTWVKIAVLAFFLALLTLILGNLKRIILTSAPDFGVLWIGAKDMLAGIDPYLDPAIYTPNAYPPISEIFYLPLGLMPYQKALAVFTFISFASIGASVFLSLKIAAKRVHWSYLLLFWGLSFMSFPAKYSLGMGQINPIVLFLLLLSLFFQENKKSIISGLIMGIAIALKPIFAFFLLYFVLKKSWKMVFISILTLVILIASTFIFWSPEIWVSWLQTGILPLSNFAGREAYVNQGVVGFISRFISNIDARIFLNGIITLILIALNIFWAVRKKANDLLFSLFILTLLLFDTTSWQHHFVWLIFPFITLFNYVYEAKNAVLLGLLAVSYLLVSWNFKNSETVPLILVSNQFYGTLILLGITIYLFYDTHNRRVGLHRPKTSP